MSLHSCSCFKLAAGARLIFDVQDFKLDTRFLVMQSERLPWMLGCSAPVILYPRKKVNTTKPQETIEELTYLSTSRQVHLFQKYFKELHTVIWPWTTLPKVDLLGISPTRDRTGDLWIHNLMHNRRWSHSSSHTMQLYVPACYRSIMFSSDIFLFLCKFCIVCTQLRESRRNPSYLDRT